MAIARSASPAFVADRAPRHSAAQNRRGGSCVIISRRTCPPSASTATEVDRLSGDSCGLLDVHDGVDVEVEENVEYRHVTCDRCDVVRLNEGEATAAVHPSEELQEVTALCRRPFSEDLQGSVQRLL